VPPLFRFADDFYPDPRPVRAAALRASYFTPAGLYGWRSTAPFFAARAVARTLRDRFGFERVVLPREDQSTGRFYLALGTGRRREPFFAHYDAEWRGGLPGFALVVYLTPDAPPDSGTGLFRHRDTGLWKVPTAAEARRLGRTRKQLIDRLHAEGHDPARWEQLDGCANVYNRAVLFPAHWYHSGLGYFGDRVANGRIYQAFFFRAAPYLFDEAPPAVPAAAAGGR
jgi:hypothetical protein